jgi:parallel beta-helix repeat protein
MFNFIKNDIPRTRIIQDIEVCIWPGGLKGEWSWIIENKSVKEIDYSSGIITLNEGTTYEIGKGSRYYVQGALEYLDSPGEFYLDKKNGDLYYWPISLPIKNQKICIPKLNRIIQLEDYSEAVSNIIFDGITLINTDISNDFNNSFDSAMIFIGYNSKNITIKDCKLQNSGDNGIMLFTKTEGNTIYGNDIFNIGRNGVFLEGGMDSIKYINKYNKIMNNHIYNIGEIIGHGKGISVHNSGDNIISHNRIHNIPRSGINITSSRVGSIIGKTIDGIFVTKENAKQFAHSRNNVIEYNDISNCAEDSEDVGLIYCWGVGTGNVINNNYLHDSDVPFSFATGIYLDDGSDDVTVTNNLITRLQKKNENGVLTSALYVKGVGNNIINNIVVDNDERSGALRTFEMAGEPNNNLIIERNIFCNSGKYIFSFTNWSDWRFKFSDYNIIYNEDENYIVNGVPYVKTFSQWKNILENKYDQHSIISEPLFMDEEKGDYRLRYDSPAYRLGFIDINYEDIGLLNDFEYADMDEEIDRLFIGYNNDIFKSYIRLKQGEQANLQVLARTKNGYKIDINIKKLTLFSSNNEIASVNSKGVVQGKSKGIAKITVETKDKTHKKSDISIIVY